MCVYRFKNSVENLYKICIHISLLGIVRKMSVSCIKFCVLLVHDNEICYIGMHHHHHKLFENEKPFSMLFHFLSFIILFFHYFLFACGFCKVENIFYDRQCGFAKSSLRINFVCVVISIEFIGL